MSKTLSKQIIEAPKSSSHIEFINVPFTDIVGRAQIPNFNKDMKARGGGERIHVKRVEPLQNEFGPNGERVFKPVDDYFDQIRFVGNWSNLTSNVGQAIQPSTGVTTNYMEVVFFGSGLNILFSNLSGSGLGLVASIDGGVEGANLIPSSYSAVLSTRNYSANISIPVISGLSNGIHTARIRFSVSANYFVSGFEILNERAGIFINEGPVILNQKRFNLMAQLLDFKPAGIGSRGGKVVIYSDGSQNKVAFTSTNPSAAFLNSADHTNEEVIRTVNFLELGANRSDDFTNPARFSSGGSAAFTLEDGTITAVCDNGFYSAVTNSWRQTGAGNFLTITFVGTGLDLTVRNTGPSQDNVNVLVNNNSVGALSGNSTTNVPYIRRIASGLPYGTHTVRLNRTVSALDSFTFENFIVYGPKTPSIPVGAEKVADYYVMADFSSSGVTATTLPDFSGQICTGVISKTPLREFVYINTWSTGPSPLFRHGSTVDTTVSGAICEYSFVGTGIIINIAPTGSGVRTFNVKIDDLNFTTGTLITSSVTNGGSGNYSITTSNGGKLGITGLPVGYHKLTITVSTTTSFYVESLDIISPIHSPRGSLFEQQNTLPVGSCSIADARGIAETKEDLFVGIAQGVTSDATTTSTVLIPAPEMSLTVPSKGSWFNVSFNGRFNHNTNGAVFDGRVYVNGAGVGSTWRSTLVAGGNSDYTSCITMIYLPPGFHQVSIYWRTNTGTLTLSTTDRVMSVEELPSQ